MQGMAFADSFYSEPAAFEYSVLHDGLCHVLAAGWLKAAIISQEGRYYLLVCSNDEYE